MESAYATAYQELVHILNTQLSNIDEVDIIDPMIIEYYKEASNEVIGHDSSNMILIEGKLGISKESLPSLFK
jgi:hypothetical protein